MKISTEWLKDYVDHDLSPEELAEKLTMGGLEVDEILERGGPMDRIVVGEILEVRSHPNADKVVLCDVQIGETAPVQIACGAPNVAQGQRVPVATIGARLHPATDKATALEITEREIRGEVSRGMICSEMELGLSEDHSGIMVLNGDAEVGEPFASYLERHRVPARDTVLDIDLTPNRPDATSHLGVARDVSAMTGAAVKRPEVDAPEVSGEAAEALSIDILAPEACPRYVGLLVRGVTVGESPDWLKQRLRSIGLRPRNNVVDVTNFVMHECGQPLHAFDFDLIEGGAIRVRLSEKGERFTTLDGEEHEVPEGTLFIADGRRPVALAGIMGGQNSEVSDETTNVLIESAYFDPTTIRKAAKALGLSTDSSYRFERGVDAGGQVWAATRAARLIEELAGGRLVPGIVDAYPAPINPKVLTLRLGRIEKILGTKIKEERVVDILERLGFGVEDEGGALECTVPLFRPDVAREIDLIEEVARIYGYDNIPTPAHSKIPNRVPRPLPEEELRRSARSLLAGRGFRETFTNSMLPQETAERFNTPVLGAAPRDGDIVETLNPISREMAALRPTLLPGMLEVMQFNRNHGRDALRFAEFGHIFRRSGEAVDALVPGYAEQESLLIGASGPAEEPGWDASTRLVDFFDLKGLVEELFDHLRIRDAEMIPSYDATPVSTYHLQIRSAGHPLGLIARLPDALAEEYDLETPVFFAELNWKEIVQLAAPEMHRRYEPVSRFPVVERDLAVVVERRQAVGPMLEIIEEAGRPLLQDVDVFDLYEGENIASDQKSVAFALRFGAKRTLRDEEVDEQVAAIVNRLESDFDAALRA